MRTRPLHRLVLALLLVPSVLFAATPVRQTPAPPPENENRLVAAIDSTVRATLDREAVPGAVVVAIQDGRVIVSKGYGTADPRGRQPMTTKETVLPVGSLAKPITATVALALVAKGRLNLNADIRQRTKSLGLPLQFDAPITLEKLLTHTSGFDNSDFGDAARSPDAALPLSTFLRRRMANQVFPPGRFYRYSNHGYALVGHLIEESVGTDFATHVDAGLFRNLGMRNSTFQQIPPTDLAKRVPPGHRTDGHQIVPVATNYSNLPPADGLLTTGEDMGQFLRAVLDTSTTGALDPWVRKSMLSTAFRYHDSLPGVTLAFQERPVNGHPGLEHTGGRIGFTSQMVLVPDARSGLFVSLSVRDSNARSNLTATLLDVLVPRVDEPQKLDATDVPAPVTRTEALVGTYRSIRYNHSNLEKLAVLLGMVPQLTVEDTAGKALRIGSGDFYEVAPLLFRWRGAEWYNAFRIDDARHTHLFSDHRAFEKVAWYERRDVHRIAIALGFLVLLSLLVLETWSWGADKTAIHGSHSIPTLRLSRTLFAGTAVAFVGGGLLFGITLPSLASTADYGAPPILTAALALVLVGALLTAPLCVAVAASLARRQGPLRGRVCLGAGTVAALLLVGLSWYWNILSFAI